MGFSLTPVSIWDTNIKIKEVVSASRLEYFKKKSLKSFSKYRGTLYESDKSNNEMIFEFTRDGNSEFIEFIEA